MDSSGYRLRDDMDSSECGLHDDMDSSGYRLRDNKDSSEFALKSTASLQLLHGAQKPCLEEEVHAP
jgi:hypothetical protein